MAAWPPEHVDLLKKLYANTSNPDLGKMFGRKASSVGDKALKLGLKKSPEFISELAKKYAVINGQKTRFAKGFTPHNKGKAFNAGGRSLETQFKRGRAPQKWRPIGSERVGKDDYLLRKISDTNTTKDWRPAHVLLWEERHGTVPQGHVIAFRDGNKRNFAPDNLECISRIEIMRRNTICRFPPELVEVIRLHSSINRTIERKSKK